MKFGSGFLIGVAFCALLTFGSHRDGWPIKCDIQPLIESQETAEQRVQRYKDWLETDPSWVGDMR